MSFKVFLDSPLATIPLRADNGCAGYDLTSIEDISVLSGERKLVSTGYPSSNGIYPSFIKMNQEFFSFSNIK